MTLYGIITRSLSADYSCARHNPLLLPQIGRDIGCMRFTTCKSAKDRTSMSLTYEYCDILCREHGFLIEDIPPVLEQFRR